MRLARRISPCDPLRVERMDTDCATYEDYARCIRDLSRVNVAALTHRPMLAWLDTQVAPGAVFSVLDVACGYGDALRAIATRHPAATLTGVDLNPWAARAARAATQVGEPITYVTGDVFRYEPSVAPDFIVSAEFTHHLDDEALVGFLRWMDATAQRGWFVSDLQRHPVPHTFFPLLARAAGLHRFVRLDGQVSFARAFTGRDWRRLLRAAGIADAVISYHVPYRLCVSRKQ